MNIRTLYVRGLKGRQLVERELDGRGIYDLPIRRRLWLWRRGFLSESEYVYDFDSVDYRQYLTDVERFVRTPLINGEWNVALSNKLIFHWLLSQFEDHRVTVFGMVRNGSYLPLDDDHEPLARAATGLADGGRSDGISVGDEADAGAQVCDLLEKDGTVVLKWIKGGGGENVYLCSRTDDGYLVNDELKTADEFASFVDGLREYLVTAFVEQSEFLSSVYPETTNTIRLLTMYDETNSEAFIPIVILRAGTDRSAPMDNFGQGGVSVEIDVETGVFGKAVQLRDATELHRLPAHPSTGRALEGVELPGWETIRDRMLDIAEANRQLPYVGWDLVPTDESGSFKILEGNSYPGMKSLQCHRPLLADDRVRAFYRHNGVLRR